MRRMGLLRRNELAVSTCGRRIDYNGVDLDFLCIPVSDLMMKHIPTLLILVACCQTCEFLGHGSLFANESELSVDSETVDFEAEVRPILESACLNCHNDTDAEGGLSLETFQAATTGGDQGSSLEPGKPEESSLYTTMVLPADHDLVMPPEGDLMAKSQTDRIRKWIEEGAIWPEDAVLAPQPRMSFEDHIQPILETQCVSCHHADGPEGGYDLTTHMAALETGDQGSSLIPFQPEESLLYTLTALDESDDQLMPPYDDGGPLDAEKVEQLRLWIAQGAVWPDELSLSPRTDPYASNPDNLRLIREIHAKIVATAAEEGDLEPADYSSTISRTDVEFQMVAIEGGEFLMGSPASEEFRNDNEGPQTSVTVAPFWIGKHEVTWDEYGPFMGTGVDRFKNGMRKDYDPDKHDVVDTVSAPTNPYIEMSFGMGQSGYPAISMTQHAANKYCQWLSAQTGHFYRLPTEAEWEYACRAGTTTAFSFGDNMDDLDQYAWYYDNSNEKYQKVGLKKPNPWGLHDMHGNVMEWTIDQYLPDYYARIKEQSENPLIRPTELYPRTVRGGNWDDDPEQLRSATRRGSDPSWKIQDPQLPKSVWYHTDARGLGFRIVRPVEIPSVEEMNFYWNSATDQR